MAEPQLSEADFIVQMIEKYRALMVKSAGLTTVQVDGQMVIFKELEDKYEHWRRKLERINGRRPMAMAPNLGSIT